MLDASHTYGESLICNTTPAEITSEVSYTVSQKVLQGLQDQAKRLDTYHTVVL